MDLLEEDLEVKTLRVTNQKPIVIVVHKPTGEQSQDNSTWLAGTNRNRAVMKLSQALEET